MGSTAVVTLSFWRHEPASVFFSHTPHTTQPSFAGCAHTHPTGVAFCQPQAFVPVHHTSRSCFPPKTHNAVSPLHIISGVPPATCSCSSIQQQQLPSNTAAGSCTQKCYQLQQQRKHEGQVYTPITTIISTNHSAATEDVCGHDHR